MLRGQVPGREAPRRNRPGQSGSPTKRRHLESRSHAAIRRSVVLLVLTAAAGHRLWFRLWQPPSRAKATAKANPAKVVNVMTRNLYLGADLTPAITASGLDRVHRGERADPARSDRQQLPHPGQGPGRGDPQEEAGPGRPAGGGALAHRPAEPRSLLNTGAIPTATTVRYDYLAELLAELNKGKGKGGKGKPQYRVASSQNEFDFEAPADENGVPATGRTGRSPTPRSTAG